MSTESVRDEKLQVINDAIKENKSNLAEQLLTESPNLLYAKDEDERSPLHWACSMNNIALVEYILSHTPSNIDLDDVRDSSGWTPIHIASSIGNVEILNLLMHRDPIPDVNQTTNSGTTALHLSISKDHLPFVRVLIEEFGANCRKKDKLGYTPLHRAAAMGSMGSCREIITKGKLVNVNAKDNEGWTALHHALAEGNGDVAVLLVKVGKADPLVVNNEGLKPIQVSVDEKVARFFKQSIEQ
ncbi:NAS6 [Candida oxycetoniae]|uniref:NAS6 n=1 Tax=Candida oxycetoniae TaxID=497107 RepID=A0AAI9SWR4_9ASCO|nr:NAS6 [Candida oxycetoniae]KAI3404284.2 NAS6 [Candida oxycetoniae]